MGMRKFQDIELASNKDKASFIGWSSTHPVLCIGSEKGSLVFYNRKSQRKIPCISKHGKKVTHGDWHPEGLLITCSEDKLLTISNQQGDTVQDSFIVKAEPTQIKWCPSSDPAKKVVTCIIGSKQMSVVDTPTTKSFVISFQATYGKVLLYEWYGEDHLIVGFEKGIIAFISVKQDTFG
jgi:WD repeat-containing protein 19